MGLGSMDEKNIAEVLQFKNCERKTNRAKENDQRCKGGEGQVLKF
jgi:hypothetical protein